MVQVEHDPFLLLVEDLDTVLHADLPGREREWTERAGLALGQVANALREHIGTHGTSGLWTSLERFSQGTLPTLARRVSTLRQEQLDSLEQALDLQHEVRRACGIFQLSGESPLPLAPASREIPDFEVIRQSGEQLLTRLRRHQEEEAKLLLEAASTDIGIGD